MPSDSKSSGFTITDRRGFADDGQPRAASEPPTAPSPPQPAGPAAPEAMPDEGPGLPGLDFHTFILSLGSSALLHLGELDPPDGGKPEPDLALAKQTIDIIAMLGEKTKGNLTPPEEKLIDSLLYDLRLRYVSASKR